LTNKELAVGTAKNEITKANVIIYKVNGSKNQCKLFLLCLGVSGYDYRCFIYDFATALAELTKHLTLHCDESYASARVLYLYNLLFLLIILILTQAGPDLSWGPAPENLFGRRTFMTRKT